MQNEWFYRLGNADPGSGFLWSGRVTMAKPVTRAQAKHLIRRKLGIKRLPARTLIMSSRELSGHGEFARNQ
jgi:hypothetical protein